MSEYEKLQLLRDTLTYCVNRLEAFRYFEDNLCQYWQNYVKLDTLNLAFDIAEQFDPSTRYVLGKSKMDQIISFIKDNEEGEK